MAIDVSRMGVFNTITEPSDRIVNLGEGGAKLGDGGTFRNWNVLRVPLRSSAEKAANNAVRETLFRSLSAAFGLEGTAAENMKALQKTLGDDVLKGADFGLDKDGRVTSGRPLTERRIAAIVERVNTLAAEEAARLAEEAARAAKTPEDLAFEAFEARVVRLPDYKPMTEGQRLALKEVIKPLYDFIAHGSVTVRLASDDPDADGKTVTRPIVGADVKLGDRFLAGFLKTGSALVENPSGKDSQPNIKAQLFYTVIVGLGRGKSAFAADRVHVDDQAMLARLGTGTTDAATGYAGPDGDGIAHGNVYLAGVLAEKFDALVAQFNAKHPDRALS